MVEEEVEERSETKVCKEGFQLFHHHLLSSHVGSCVMVSFLTGVVFFRSAGAEGLRGGAAWRARRDAGRSRAAA